MTTHKGIAPLIIVLGIAVVLAFGVGAYVATHQADFKTQGKAGESATQTAPGDHPEEDHDATPTGKIGIHWKFDTKPEINNIPQTDVSVQVGETVYEVGTFQGSCREIGASGGIDGKGLLAGEVAGAQCYFAGAGDEIGVFAHEDGGYQVMTGDISEPDGEGSTGLRGNFKIKVDIKSAIPAGAI